MALLSYRRHRFPPEIIQHAVWLYLRFTLSYRDVEKLLAERARHLLRNGAALGAEIRSRDRAPAAPAASSAERSLASGRDGGADRREADVPLACRRPRGRGPRPACPAPARQPGGAAADAQAAQEARLRTEIAGHRQAALLRRGVPPSAPDLPARARAAQEQ